MNEYKYYVQEVGSIDGAKQLAFLVMMNGTVYIGRSGHDAMIRQAGVCYVDVVGGG